ncbi:hydrolase [Pseudonocardia acaciae]|uniref:hydrolase n=1 Tax=Pseudonocardia acaciae TaxID=551276 RepID=UPI00048BD5D6|nr:hydrolase [Pseudonocardia acaciae]
MPDPQGFYLTGRTTVFASRDDQRFSYCLYLPAREADATVKVPLVVIMHGTGRTNVAYRDAFADFAEKHGCAILAPLFPAGIGDPEDLHNFKFISYGDIRFDRVLLAIVAEVGERFGIDTERFCLHGFSGGGQFTHRFFYLHPERLSAVSIGAPGRVTLLDGSRPWWLGTDGFAERFGRDIDVERMREVPVQMVVGDRDVETWEINNPGHSNWMDGAELAGRTRIERLHTLAESFRAAGIAVRLDVVPGVDHNGHGVLPAVKDFFAGVLTGELIR